MQLRFRREASVFRGTTRAGKLVSIFLPGFQQFGEKQCGKESGYLSNTTQAAHFGALHIRRCEY
jgi:hypothetical protein